MSSKIDLAFLLDCTSSMSSYIAHAKKNITKIADEIIRAEKCQLRLALVEYRDHPPQDHTFITKVNQFTDDINVAKTFISKCSACGGGDLPESICCAFYDCLNNLEWRDDAVKIAILIADAPPHGLHGVSGDGLPTGCPNGNDPFEIANKMAEKSITLYCVGCEPSLTPYRNFFITSALVTGGYYIPLDHADNLTDVIIGGTREEVSMEKLMAQVHNEVLKEAADKGEAVNEEELTKRIHEVLNSKGAKTNKLKIDNNIEITEHIKEMSKLKTMTEINEYMKEKNVAVPNIFNTYTSPISLSASLPGLGIVRSLGLGKVRRITKRRKSITGIKRRKSNKVSTSLTAVPKTKTIKAHSAKNKIAIRRSPRLALKRNVENTESESEIENVKAVKLPNKKPKLEKVLSKTSIKSDENVDIEQARRLVKKSIARNKLKK